MKVIELQAREGIGSLVIGERAKPEPGPGEILIRIKAVTLNYRDLAIAQGIFNLPEAFRRVVTLNCISVGSRSAFEALVAATEAQQLKPVISRVFSFDEIHNAYEYLASGTHLGKVAIELA